MFYRLAAPVLSISLALGAAFPLAAQTAPADPVEALFAQLQMPEMIEVMRLEGIDYGKQVATDLIPGGSDADWVDAVNKIYDADRMRTEVIDGFHAALDGQDTAAMLEFFTTEPGKTIAGLEVSARRAMLDDAVESASKDAAALAMADRTARFQQIERFIAANDLIETNVAGGLNANYAFYMGLKDGGGLPGSTTLDQILSDVAGQEDQVRQSTTEWLYSFLMLAYHPLSDADLETYIAFSETDPGQALNRAIFTSFDALFEDVSRQLGVAAAARMGTQDL